MGGISSKQPFCEQKVLPRARKGNFDNFLSPAAVSQVPEINSRHEEVGIPEVYWIPSNNNSQGLQDSLATDGVSEGRDPAVSFSLCSFLGVTKGAIWMLFGLQDTLNQCMILKRHLNIKPIQAVQSICMLLEPLCQNIGYGSYFRLIFKN